MSATTLDQIKSTPVQLSIGTLTGDMMHQGNDIALLENAGINLLHLDVMDGKAWPKITVGAPFLAGLKTDLLKDVHLLIEEPEKHIEDFAKAGADIISFCVEHTDDIALNLKLIGEAENANDPSRGILRGVSIYPTTPLEVIQPYMDQIDVVFVLAIGPDTGKETFFDVVRERVACLRDAKPELIIAIDGAVKKNNVGEIASMGSDLIVTGSAIFDGNDATQNILEMQQSMT